MKKILFVALALIVVMASCVKDPQYPGVTISNVKYTPTAVQENDDVTVTATISCFYAVNVNLFYTVGEQKQISVAMTEGQNNVFSAVIPGQADGAKVSFYIVADGSEVMTTTSPAMEYVVGAVAVDYSVLRLNELNGRDKFIEIYNATMDKDHAEEYYYFKRPFYESIHNDLRDNYEMFYAMYEGKPIAMSIMIYANGRLNYHLSGSDIEYRNLAPSNLLLYKAALWGCEKDMKIFHLGGGVGSGEDNLYRFKAAFNKVSDYQFSIGKQIFDQGKYDELVKIRRELDPNFDETSHYFPLYRA